MSQEKRNMKQTLTVHLINYKKLQKALKEETALRETFAKNKDEILKKVDINCYHYYKNKVAIQEILDANKLNKQKVKIAKK